MDRPPSACGYNQATCMNGECIDRSQICDGHHDCADGSDENSCRGIHGLCEPNEYKCANKKCVLKTWRCDGENDCGDNSDEEGCTPAPVGSPCRHDEFQCRSGQCIPKAFQCDTTPDCQDRTDEVGCTAPIIITPPAPSITLDVGTILNITCRATGVPTPLVVWRLNWGHVPEKCTTESYDGFGILTCPDVRPNDQGAYSCEVINTKGTTFATPDTILIVVSPNGTEVCPSGYFNDNARRREDCLGCFCFGVSTQCNSANLFSYTLTQPTTSLTVEGVEGPWSGVQGLHVGEFQNHDLIATRHGVQLRLSDIPSPTRQYPYYALPNEYLRNQLKSYGGFLRYEVKFNGRGSPNSAPDVIISGNGKHIIYRHPHPLVPDQVNPVTARIYAGTWHKLDDTYASREEILMILAKVDKILIKLQYVDGPLREVELLNIKLDSAASSDKGLGPAIYVEECRCPAGYRGLSCEECDYGYDRQNSGPWLGRCVRVNDVCRPGTYGDPQRGIPCRPCPCPGTSGNSYATSCSLDRQGAVICNCERGYQGSRCEECASGYVGNPIAAQPCVVQQVSNCNRHGTESVYADGRCHCKQGVIGKYCDLCAPGTFHLSQKGCLECFCNGVTKVCSSSNLYRDIVQSSFSGGRSRFSIVSGHDDPREIATDLPIEGREIVYRFYENHEETYYWSLPSDYLGNKITSYGGNLTYTLRYTPLPSGSASRNSAPDVIIKSVRKCISSI